jgi:hypothetical protein
LTSVLKKSNWINSFAISEDYIMAFQPTLTKFGVPLTAGSTGIDLLMPKLRNRFRVSLQNFGPVGSALDITRQVMKCGRPSLTTPEGQVQSYNNIMYYAGRPEWGAITLSVRDDVNNSASVYVGAQLQKQMNHFDQTSPLAGINYKFFMQLETLDGGDTGVLENWYLEGCWLTSVTYGDFDYSDNSGFLEIDMNIRFDNATSDNNVMPQAQAATGTGTLIG